MSIFMCPVCKGQLQKEDRLYRCEKNHSFDMAKEGYVNLLISNKSTDFSGDDKQMVASRTRFLDGGYYEPLRNKIASVIDGIKAENKTVLDAGCGEGYYTSLYADYAEVIAGIDISKAAIRHAAKRCKKASFAVASVYHLPVGDETCDVIVNCFSPNAPDEFSRVLKKGGYLLYVVPGASHLWELKSILYDNPYENEEKTEEYDGFVLERVEEVKTRFELCDKEDIMALFHMTPYTWTTPKEGTARLENIQKLSVGADFKIHIYKRI